MLNKQNSWLVTVCASSLVASSFLLNTEVRAESAVKSLEQGKSIAGEVSSEGNILRRKRNRKSRRKNAERRKASPEARDGERKASPEARDAQ